MVTNMYPTSDRPSYGAFVKAQIDSIAADGHHVEVLYIKGWQSKLNYARAIGQLRVMTRSSRFDIVHAHYGLSGFVALAQRDCPVVLSFCGDDLLGTPNGRGGLTWRSRAVVWMDQLLARSVRRIIVKSGRMLESLRFEDARRKAVVIPNGVDFDRFAPMDRSEARHRLGLREDGRYVLFPSDPAVPGKRVDLARKAVASLSSDYADVELIVLHGQVQELVPVYMNACDAMVLTSDSEGSPNVVKEAMACNMPVVTVDAGDAWEIICGAANCHRAEREPRAIAVGLERVLSSGERSDGRERISHLELGAVARRVIAVYESALAEG